MMTWKKKLITLTLHKLIKTFNILLCDCLKYEKKTESKNQRKSNNFIKCVVYNSKKLRFVKEQDGSVLLSSWRIKKPLSKITLVDLLLF